MECVFALKCQLADDDRDLDAWVERLGEAGCDDAMVGIGQPGRLALEFTREAESADAAMYSALADVRRAAPSAKLIEAAPDWVGLTEVAEIVNVSRQNIRKLMLSHPDSFPTPVHQGGTSIWHLADVLACCRSDAATCSSSRYWRWRKPPCGSTWRRKGVGCRVRHPGNWKRSSAESWSHALPKAERSSHAPRNDAFAAVECVPRPQTHHSVALQ